MGFVIFIIYLFTYFLREHKIQILKLLVRFALKKELFIIIVKLDWCVWLDILVY